MFRSEWIKLTVLSGAIFVALALQSDAQGRPPMRFHDEVKAEPLRLGAANVQLNGARSEIRDNSGMVRISANGVPEHKVGSFPNAGNPNRITAQRHHFKAPKGGETGTAQAFGLGSYFGVAINGVPFDPGAAEFWQGNPRSGWQYEALGGAVTLGLDANYAHVQPDGSYHYHGLPSGLMQDMGWTPNTASPLIGYAADGFPVYAITALVDGRLRAMQSSYKLKFGSRPGGAAPGGVYDGAFVQDYTFRAGSGDLDECNGAIVRTAEHPQGSYAYFLTREFPVIPRCLKGQANRSFSKR